MKFSVNIATFIIYLGPCCSFSFWYGRLTVVWVWPFNMLLSLCMQPSLSTPSLLCWTHTSVIRWRQLWCICSVYRVLYSVCVFTPQPMGEELRSFLEACLTPMPSKRFVE